MEMRIAVDVIPMSCIKCELYIDFDFSPYCPVLRRKFNLEKEGYTTRLDACPLEIEQVCEWVQEKTERGYAAFYESPHENGAMYGTTEKSEFLFCSDCGKRIVYVESENQ
jgi:hypothetical protein